MSSDTVVALAPEKIVVFRSVLRPALALDPEDVEPCPECEHLSPSEYERIRVLSGVECSCCMGHRLIHGIGARGGYPVALVEGVAGAGASESPRRRTGSHLPAPRLPRRGPAA